MFLKGRELNVWNRLGNLLKGGVGRDLGCSKFGKVVSTVVQSVLGEPLTSRVDPPDLRTGFLKCLGW